MCSLVETKKNPQKDHFLKILLSYSADWFTITPMTGPMN